MYCQNEPRFNGVYSRDNPPDKIKDRAYVINLDEYSDIGLINTMKDIILPNDILSPNKCIITLKKKYGCRKCKSKI